MNDEVQTVEARAKCPVFFRQHHAGHNREEFKTLSKLTIDYLACFMSPFRSFFRDTDQEAL
jgi:hypothetical protein